MKELEIIKRGLEKYFPTAILSIDAPDNDLGSWFLDVFCDGKEVVLEYQPAMGNISISFTARLYGDNTSDLVVKDPYEALRQVSLFLSKPKGG